MVQRRRVDVALIGRSRISGGSPDVGEIARSSGSVSSTGVSTLFFGPQILDPRVGAEIDALPALVRPSRSHIPHQRELIVDDAQPPGVEPVGAAVHVIGEGPLEAGGRQAL